MKQPIFAANWKMNHAPADATAFMRAFLAHFGKRQDRSVIFFPPALSFGAVVGALKDRPDIQLGVQNIYWEDKARTPENRHYRARVSTPVGHSERATPLARRRRPAVAAARRRLTPIVCVGETLAQREAGQTEQVVLRQLRAALSTVTSAEAGNAIIAYEPVWAIGTGKTATPADASAVHQAIGAELHRILDSGSLAVPILYGGSVNRGNAADLLAAPEVDGLLVGGASLDAEGWASIVLT
jgi:triosephosphate isomerase